MNDEIREIFDTKLYFDLEEEDYIKIKNYITNLQKENERLNNVINELEKYIKENSIYYNTSDGCQWIDQFKVLDKLKELKENRDEE